MYKYFIVYFAVVLVLSCLILILRVGYWLFRSVPDLTEPQRHGSAYRVSTDSHGAAFTPPSGALVPTVLPVSVGITGEPPLSRY